MPVTSQVPGSQAGAARLTVLRSEQPGGSCGDCRLRSRCLPSLLSGEALQRFQQLLPRPRNLRAGEHLFRVGDEFQAVFSVASGCLKTYAVDPEGREHVLNFHFPGELLGVDAVYPEQHMSNAVALAPSTICSLPFRGVMQLAQEIPELQEQLVRLLSRDLFSMTSIAGDFTAEERLAAFLVMVSARLRGAGAAPTSLELAMSRQDIASYLRLATETVSRILARFQKGGLLKADRRQIRLLDPAGLYEIGACMNPYARCSEARKPRHVRPFRAG
jgi:CRP/FNR family transcriptional regulator